jgi:HSP20 family protein
MERISDEMDRWFGRVGRELGFSDRGFGGGGMRAGGLWIPRVESMLQGDQFIARVELPGVKKEDVQVEVMEESLVIRGERRHEHEEQNEGFYQTEREYGEFHRIIPLPSGAIAESAEATFRDGVLEVRMNAAPSEASQGRRIEIKSGSEESRR